MKHTILLIASLLHPVIPASAAVTVLNYYRLGDADPGAVSGSVANSLTTDSVGSSNLTRSGSPTYSSSLPASSVGGTSNILAISFSGASTDAYSFATRLTDTQNNFGLEVFVNSSTVSGNANLVYNGKPGSSGFGLHRIGNLYQALLGTNPGTFFGSSNVITGSWVHLALVRDNGISTFYVDGIASGTSAGTPKFGSNPFALGSSNFSGLLDEVRVFTFTAGAFSTNDLLINQVPEPGYATLFLVGVAGLLTRRSRTRRD